MIASDALGLRAVREYTGKGFRPEKLFPGFDSEVFQTAPATALPDFYLPDEGRLTTSIHSWLFKLDGKLVLVDACMGMKKAEDGDHAPFIKNLSAAGVSPDDIDLVVLTHLHTDHMKWNTRQIDGAWVPTFKNARYFAGAREYDHWQPGGRGLELYPEQAEILAECIAPLLEAGQLNLIDDDATIHAGLTAMPAPGHTATQLALLLEHDGQSYIFAADSLHHPVQIHHPEWGSFLCEDQVTALATRRQILGMAADRGALLLPSHFAGSHAARVHRDASGFIFEPAIVPTEQPVQV